MDFTVKNLGQCTVPSPLLRSITSHETAFVDDDERMLYDPLDPNNDSSRVKPDRELRAGRAAETDLFRPEQRPVRHRDLRRPLPRHQRRDPLHRHDILLPVRLPVDHSASGTATAALTRKRGTSRSSLNPDLVEDIHLEGGTILGSSRGGTEDMETLVDTLARLGVNILYTIGGDGTLRGAHRIAEIARAARPWSLRWWDTQDHRQ